MVRNAVRASRPGLAVGHPSGVAQRHVRNETIHVENEEHSCRVWCPVSQTACPIITGALSFLTSSARFGGTPSSTLVKTVYCMISSLRYVIEACSMVFPVMGFMSAFVNAHNYHRHLRTTQENSRIALEVRLVPMTAIAPAFAHAYQAICLARRPIDILCQRFRLTSAKANYSTPHHPSLPLPHLQHSAFSLRCVHR